MTDSNLPLLVFTDLDGTLLDHDNYTFSAALPALNKLKSLHVPIIPITSKTLSELNELLKEFDLDCPVIAENGGVIASPKGLLKDFNSDICYKGFEVLQLSPVYSVIKHSLEEIKKTHGFKFTGFSDLNAAQVAELTGLSKASALQAKERLCSEPIVWQDSAENLSQFEVILRNMDFSLTRGGRFYHVMGDVDKGKAMLKLAKLYPGGNVKIALGDSPNDISMLVAADFAVVINRKNGTPMVLDKKPDLFYQTQGCGPVGWQEFFDYFFATYVDERNNKLINIEAK